MMAVGVSSGRPWKQGAWVTPAWPTVGAPPLQWGLCLPETPQMRVASYSHVLPSVAR